LLKETVEDYNLSMNMSVDDLVKQMKEAWGFTAGKIAIGVEILENMVNDHQCLKFLSFPACLAATGVRGVLRDLLKKKLINVVITTSGTLDHDIARSWESYYRGSFKLSDRRLHRLGINRLGNVLIPNESYGSILENKMQQLLSDLWSEGVREISSRELAWEAGHRICHEDSILYWAYKNKIPIYIPGLTDGAVGYQLWMFSQNRDFTINPLKDEQEINDLIFSAKKTGGLIIGGGISKHHTIWWNQFKGGLDYVIYITTAVEWDGSLSGARVHEAVSWGKVKENAKKIGIEGDASVILPIMITSLITRRAKTA
jgi:deoxyhypusine synthase